MKILVAMSGGVDSSVAAWLLQQDGKSCAGAIMALLPCKAGDIRDAQAVADRLGMPLHVFDMEDTFRQNVIEPFVSDYESGLTPNPCVVCNRRMKFGAFLDRAVQLGFSHVATGHYARVELDRESGRYLLKKAADTAKDQSYFLCQLSQEQLAHTLFPLGNLTKNQSREIALEQGLITARKRDSQDVCFIPDGDYLNFLQRFTGKLYESGDFLDTDHKKIGTHKGAVAYTLGQRKGLGIAMGEPVYVCAKDMAANTVTVGRNEDLFRSELIAGDFNWIAIEPPSAPIRVMAKARSRMTEQPATLYPMEGNRARLVFDQPQRALTPGQTLAIYDGDTVLAGATITQILPHIRKAVPEDFTTIEAIYDNARAFMRQTGNLHQWVGGYPSRETIMGDMDAGQLYVCEEYGEILGVFCFFIGDDPTYERIYEGAWLKEGQSGVIHRIAIASPGKGVARACFDYAFARCGNIRIDTHRDNAPMHRALTKSGFTRCGIIYLQNGDERIAYQKI